MIFSANNHQNTIIALLNGPDTRYEKLLMNENLPMMNKSSFLQIHVRPLNTKQQKRLFDKHHKCLEFTFPIPYPCLSKSKKINPNKNRLKSAVNILFNDDKILKENHSSNACYDIVHRLLQLNNDI